MNIEIYTLLISTIPLANDTARETCTEKYNLKNGKTFRDDTVRMKQKLCF